MARLRRPLTVVVTIFFASITLAACGSSDGLADARRACVKVERALAIERAADAPGVPSAHQAQLHAQAMTVVLSATGDAARANSSNGSWNALMTSISQAGQVPLIYLEPTLSSQCDEVMRTASGP